MLFMCAMHAVILIDYAMASIANPWFICGYFSRRCFFFFLVKRKQISVLGPQHNNDMLFYAQPLLFLLSLALIIDITSLFHTLSK